MKKNILVYMLGDKAKNKYSNEWFDEILELYNVTDLIDFKQRVFKNVDGEDIIFKEECYYLYKEIENRYKKVENTSFAFTKDGFVPVFSSQKVPYQEEVINRDKGVIVKTDRTHYFYGNKHNFNLRPSIVVESSFTNDGLILYTNNGNYEFVINGIGNIKKAILFDNLYFYLKEKIDYYYKNDLH